MVPTSFLWLPKWKCGSRPKLKWRGSDTFPYTFWEIIIILLICFSQTLAISEFFLQIVLILKKNYSFMLQIHYSFKDLGSFKIIFDVTWMYIA